MLESQVLESQVLRPLGCTAEQREIVSRPAIPNHLKQHRRNATSPLPVGGVAQLLRAGRFWPLCVEQVVRALEWGVKKQRKLAAAAAPPPSSME